ARRTGGVRIIGGVRRAAVSPDRPGVRDTSRSLGTRASVLFADVRASVTGIAMRHLAADAGGPMVSERRAIAGIAGSMSVISANLTDILKSGMVVPAHSPWRRVIIDNAAWQKAADGLAAGE